MLLRETFCSLLLSLWATLDWTNDFCHSQRDLSTSCSAKSRRSCGEYDSWPKPPHPWLEHCSKTLIVVRNPLSCVIDSMSYQILCVFNQITSLAARQLRSYKPAAAVAQAASAGSISGALEETGFCAAKVALKSDGTCIMLCKKDSFTQGPRITFHGRF